LKYSISNRLNELLYNNHSLFDWWEEKVMSIKYLEGGENQSDLWPFNHHHRFISTTIYELTPSQGLGKGVSCLVSGLKTKLRI
jgi:hypothetical protein